MTSHRTVSAPSMGSPLRLDLRLYLDDGRTDMLEYSHGRRARRRAKLDEVDQAGRQGTIALPAGGCVISDVFLLGLLGASIRRLGLPLFEDRYVVTGSDVREEMRDMIATAGSLGWATPAAASPRSGILGVCPRPRLLRCLLDPLR